MDRTNRPGEVASIYLCYSWSWRSLVQPSPSSNLFPRSSCNRHSGCCCSRPDTTGARDIWQSLAAILSGRSNLLTSGTAWSLGSRDISGRRSRLSDNGGGPHWYIWYDDFACTSSPPRGGGRCCIRRPSPLFRGGKNDWKAAGVASCPGQDWVSQSSYGGGGAQASRDSGWRLEHLTDQKLHPGIRRGRAGRVKLRGTVSGSKSSTQQESMHMPSSQGPWRRLEETLMHLRRYLNKIILRLHWFSPLELRTKCYKLDSMDNA